MYNYRKDLSKLPSYDVVERPWEIKVNANECGMNLPPLVEDRIMSRLSNIAFNRYPNEQMDDLKDAIARNFGMQPENVLLGNGSSEIVEKVFYAFGGRNHKIVYAQPSFSMYGIYAKYTEAEAIPFDLYEEDYSLNVKAFVQTINENKASLAVICNPNNPTGNYLPLDQIEYVLEHTSCPLFLDEAYIEFCGGSGVGLMKKYPQLMVARTFSKAYGLASIRCGYLLAQKDLAEMIGKGFMPYHINVMSLIVADTVFQMRDEYIPRIQMMVAERKRMEELYSALPGFKVFPSSANFIFMKYENSKALNERLESISYGIRSFGDAPRLKNCLRISIGTRMENDEVYKAVKEFVEAMA